jgi:maltose alpha-D-glucosyltransferase/alpha-amylase
MFKTKLMEKLIQYWEQLYGNDKMDALSGYIEELRDLKNVFLPKAKHADWYRDAVVYSLYVDLFNKDFDGLQDKLPYLKDLGVNCIWLLPILESPMRDAGFDISDYRNVRSELFKERLSLEQQQQRFRKFLEIAHSYEIKVIFDIAINHTSNQHPWFIEASKGEDNPYRHYYIWSETTDKYRECRLLFKGMCDSNWEPYGDTYFFHRFFEFQPDLNYRNPEVLIEMCRNLVFWMQQGVDGFRADAIPYLWKEEGTDCENLPKTHIIVKFFRAVIDFLKPDTLLLAEACQPPKEVVKYMGDGDECHAGYHFPLMPQIFKTIASQSADPIHKVLSPEVTPNIPKNCQWFTFLRCHDELSLELVYVSEEDRAYIHKNYCHNPLWDFRLGEGISARLADLMKQDYRLILLSYSIMLTLPGTPVIYYGDEFAKRNDFEYYERMIKNTGHNDTRFLVRGIIDWDITLEKIESINTLESKVFNGIRQMLTVRNSLSVFGRGEIEWYKAPKGVLAYVRSFGDKRVLVINNLSSESVSFPFEKQVLISEVLIGANEQTHDDFLQPYAYKWLLVK